MKKCVFRYQLAFLILLFGFPGLSAKQVVWKDAKVRDVSDEDLLIKNNVLLPIGATTIKAVRKDVTVEFDKDLTISGHWAGPSRLYLIAKGGHKITFKINHDVIFSGSSSVASNEGADLLIIQSCPGTVDFSIAANNSLTFTGSDTTFGVQMYVMMYGGANAPIDEYCDEYNFCQKPLQCDEYQTYNPQTGACCDEYDAGCSLPVCDENDEYCVLPCSGINEISTLRPVMLFSPLENSTRFPNGNRTIIIGEKSRLGFLSSRPLSIAGDSAYISFDAASASAGRMVLEIQDKGSLLIGGIFTDQRNARLIELKNIHPEIAAGNDAIVAINNNLGDDFSGGLLVLNRNQTLFNLLVDPFLTLNARSEITDFRGSFVGCRFGVVLAANGTLWIKDNAYLDYVGLALNQIPNVIKMGDCRSIVVNRELKSRNPSALFVDGNNDPASAPAQIIFGGPAAAFFRSGVGENGQIRFLSDVDPFTVDADDHVNGVGNIVLDVEGELNVQGPADDGARRSKIELLSLEVIPTGGSLFVNSRQTNFPLRTFNTEDGQLLAYNTGAFLINNQVNLYNTSLVHSDVNHEIFVNNDTRSEPTYIGGETFRLLDSDNRPAINFFNADLHVESDIAITGFDLDVPNLVTPEGLALANLSRFIFYANGACIDNGTGRQMILGTRIGSTAVDGCSRIDQDAHLNIMQQTDAIESDNGQKQTLLLTTSFNDAAVSGVVSDQETSSIHTIFLGGASNISIGTNQTNIDPIFNIITHPLLRIRGNVFSFETKNGARSFITGKNGIFVDSYGKISIDPNNIANFAVNVVKSDNGVVNLPSNQVFFADGFGIANWDVDLSKDRVLVPAGHNLSTYVFNWIIAKKDCDNFSPYQITDVNMCNCPPVTYANVRSLPTIRGTVDDLVIQATRIGDPVQFLVDGGMIRQLEFPGNACSAEAPVAVIILRNNGTVGLDASTTLGANGITIIADGSGRVNINSDMIINNVCAFVKGPHFGADDILQIYSPTAHTITLKSGAVLDLTSFNTIGDPIEFAGQVRLVVEPGATIITGRGTLIFADDSSLFFEPAVNVAEFFEAIRHGAHDPSLDPNAIVKAAQPHNQFASLIDFGRGLRNTDPFRVSLVGQGVIEFRNNAQAFIPNNAFVGVETLRDAGCRVRVTDLELRLTDNAQFVIGRSDVNQGGVLQVGNVVDLGSNAAVNFTLTLDGDGAVFVIGSQAFVGFGVGIERFDGALQAQGGASIITRQPSSQNVFVPNENIVNTLKNVNQITFNFLNGEFEHDRIASGDSPSASLVAVSGDPVVSFNVNFNPEEPSDNDDVIGERESQFDLAGGGNFALINPGVGGIHPIVLGQDGVMTERLSSSIMASTLLQTDNEDVSGLSGAQFFDLFKTHDALLERRRQNTFGRANAASAGDSFRPQFNFILVDTVSDGDILRTQIFDMIGAGQNQDKRRNAIDAGAVLVNIDPASNQIITVTNIPNL